MTLHFLHQYPEKATDLASVPHLSRHSYTVCGEGAEGLETFGFGRALNASDSGRATLPIIGRGYFAQATALKFFKRTFSGKSFDAFGSRHDLHATQHGDNQCANPGSHTPDKFPLVQEQQNWVR